MEENNLPINTSVEDQQFPGQLINPIQKINNWKLRFIVVLLILLLSMGLLIYLVINNMKLSSLLTKSITSSEVSITPLIVPSVTPQVGNAQKISVKIDPYRLDDEEGQVIATFQITNLNKDSHINKVTYWTDKNGACKAKIQAFSEFIKIPANEINDYAFFQFTGEKIGTSEIYASSPNPIFQCEKLAE